MADPLSIAASVLTVVTAAIQTTKSLHETVQSYKDRDKTLRRLLDELDDLMNILQSLRQVADTDAMVLELLKRPVERCGEVCRQFEETMKRFGGKSKMPLKDWAKMEFMSGDINGFIDTIAGYKSTIAVGLGTITMQTAKLSQQVIEDYEELIKDTAYNLNIHLQRIDEKLARMESDGSSGGISVNLQDERDVTQLCLRVCEDAKSYIDSLQDQSPGLRDVSQEATPFVHNQFQAQLLTRQTLNENRTRLVDTIARLQTRLQSIEQNDSSTREEERARLQEDISISKQCLEVCREASDQVSTQKIHTFGEVIAEGDSDQVVVTTLADLFDIRKAKATGRAAQLLGSMTDETLQRLSEDRYKSANIRFGAAPGEARGEALHTRNAPSQRKGQRGTAAERPSAKPLPNEVRRREAEGEGS